MDQRCAAKRSQLSEPPSPASTSSPPHHEEKEQSVVPTSEMLAANEQEGEDEGEDEELEAWLKQLVHLPHCLPQ